MRRWPIAAAIAGLALALAGVALATTQFSQTSNITLTGHKAGASTGIKADVESKDPGAPGAKPKAAKSLVVTFPKGTKFNFGKVHPCTLSDKVLTTPGGATCPASSKIGTGSAVANASPLPFGSVSAKVTSYVHSSTDVILWVTSKIAAPIVIHEKVSGSKLTIPVPTQKVGTVSIVLTKLTLNVPANGSGSSSLITAGKCTAGKFVVKSHFVYVDGSTFDTTSASKCS